MTKESSKRDRLPILDVQNPDEKIDSIGRVANEVRDRLIFVSLEYTNKITGRLLSSDDDRFITLRDSIFYRMSALLFHLRLLLAVQDNQLGQLNQSLRDPAARHAFLFDQSEHQFQIFDSIVFHSISLFDYFGNLIDFVCGTKKETRLKWNGVIRSVRDPSNPLSRSPIASIVRQLHQDLVNRLYEHRSDLIHYSTDLGGAQTTHHIMEGRYEFVVFSPRRITQRFPELRSLATTNRLALNYVSFWVCDKTVNSARELIAPILEHINLNRRTPPGSEIFTFSGGAKQRTHNRPQNDTHSSEEPKG